ncbi:MAG: alpha/beta fold hydrolase [Solirubrobacteraceae bacterium]
MSRHVEISDTRLHVVERGGEGLPLLVLHGGPALDHHLFGDYLDPLGDEFHLVLVDQRSQGLSDRAPIETWTLERMAADVGELAEAMGFDRYATLGHSYGAFVVLQHAVDHPGHAAATIVSSGVPSARYLAAVEQNLAAFEPVELREQVTRSWAREQEAQTAEECEALLHDQLPFHFADPRDPRMADFERRTAGMVTSPDMLRHFATADYGAIEVEDRLAAIPQPTLVLAGRHDRVCVVAAGEAIAAGIPGAELVVFEHSGHLTYAEENEAYLAAVRSFLQSVP